MGDQVRQEAVRDGLEGGAADGQDLSGGVFGFESSGDVGRVPVAGSVPSDEKVDNLA